MKKLFIALLVLCALGAGVLWWLMQAVPAPNPLAPKAELKSESEVPAEVAGHSSEAAEEGHAEKAEKAEKVEKAEHAAEGEYEKKSSEIALTINTEPVKAEVFVDDTLAATTPAELKIEPGAKEIVLKAEGYEEYKREAPTVADGPIVWKVQLKPLKGQLKSPPHKASAKPAAKKKEAAAPIEVEKPAATEEKPVSHADAKHAEAKHAEPKHAEAKHAAPNHEEAEPAHTAPKAAKTELDEQPVTPEHAAEAALHSPAFRKTRGYFLQLESLPASEAAGKIEKKRADYQSNLDSNVSACHVDLGAKGKWTRLIVGPFANKNKAAEALGRFKGKIPEGSFVSGVQPCL